MRCMQTYESVKQLRYGHLMIMTDQDHDGSHIKGLIMNFLHHFYPSLLHVPGFLLEFITPIVKVWASNCYQVRPYYHAAYTQPHTSACSCTISGIAPCLRPARLQKDAHCLPPRHSITVHSLMHARHGCRCCRRPRAGSA